MYFPYLRGKQFELIALRELLEKGLISSKIIPIVEPLKLSSTLTKTIKMFKDREHNCILICNPQVGSLVDAYGNVINEYSEFFGKSILPGIINNQSLENLIELLNNICVSEEEIAVIHRNSDFLKKYDKVYYEKSPLYNIIPESRYRRKVKGNRVLITDGFNKQKRNSDYLEWEDEFFSEEHLYYLEEGYYGVADYTITGDNYTDSGFLPFAVAIHITYFDKENNLRIKHFVSDSNSDVSDTPNKFYEALKKLISWKRECGVSTYALDKFEGYYDDGSYPGLGSIKKLSIMHHIEIMSDYLEEH